MMHRVLAVAAGLWIVGCEAGYEEVEHPEGDEAWEIAEDIRVDDQEVVATVDGHALTRSDFEAKWRKMPEASRTEVLDELIEREVLARRARERGYHERPEVSFARKQGLVSALLAERVEGQAEPDETRRDAVRDHVRRTRGLPEGLRASHLVVLVAEDRDTGPGEPVELDEDRREELFDRALEYLHEARDQLDGRVDDDALREVAEWLDDEMLGAELDAEVNEHMRFPRAGRSVDRAQLPDGWVGVVPEFAEGAESVAGPEQRGQELSEPVRTEFGWHLIRVDEVIEARPVDPEAERRYVDFELRQGAREARLHQLMEEWAADVPARVYPDRLGSALED